jgi:hypothetical protein
MSQPQKLTNEEIITRLIMEHQRLVSEQSALNIQSTNFISFLMSKLNIDANKPINNESESSEDQTVRGSTESTE